MKLEIGLFISISIIFITLYFYQNNKKNVLSNLGLFFYILQFIGLLGKYQTKDFIEITSNTALVPFISYLIGYYFMSVLACILLFSSIKKYNNKKIIEIESSKSIIKDKTTKVKEKKEHKFNKKTSIIITLSILISLLLFLGIYFLINYINSLKADVAYYKDLYDEYSQKYYKICNEKGNIEFKSILQDSKIKFFDENIVFIIDGYGNYYYTYDEMQQVTQGKSYSYLAYNKESAISQGYKPFQSNTTDKSSFQKYLEERGY